MAGHTSTAVQSYLDWSDKGKASVWRYAVSTVLVMIVFYVLSGMLLVPFTVLVPDYADSLPLSVVSKLLVFLITFLAIPLIVRLVHKRPFWSVAMPALRFRAWDFFTGLRISFAIAAIAALAYQATGIIPVQRNPDFDLPTVLLLAVVGLVGNFVQAGAEELTFRGYFTQFARRFTSSKMLFLGIPALLFAAPHITNIAEYRGSPLVMIPYFVSGLLYGWAAYRSGSLRMSVALHLVNNYTALVFVGATGDARPSAAPYLMHVPSLPVATVAILLQSAAVFIALSLVMKRAGVRASLSPRMGRI
jgi:membrane protease YdiL (CAAX protease family)